VTTTGCDPIFILGIRPRCGTHFLANLLCQHPACVTSALAEDALLVDADLLARYVERHHDQWAQIADGPWHERADLLFECLGDALRGFLLKAKAEADAERLERFGAGRGAAPQARRLVTKTPVVDHLDLFFKLWPRGQVIILVRDGRAVVESSVRSFGTDRETEIRAWAAAADRIAEFERAASAEQDRYRIVRYEDLHTETDETMRTLFPFLGLDAGVYDFDRARNLPVVGSSTFKRPAGPLSWTPVSKTPAFDPLAHARDWPRAWHERFNWLAGRQMNERGYDLHSCTGARLSSALTNRAKDAVWSMRRWSRRRARRPGRLLRA